MNMIEHSRQIETETKIVRQTELIRNKTSTKTNGRPHSNEPFFEKLCNGMNHQYERKISANFSATLQISANVSATLQCVLGSGCYG